MRLAYEFYHRDCLTVAKELVGKLLITKKGADEKCLRITETEAYFGENDTACHAHKGRTKRSEALYMDAGTVYVYLCYGIHHLMNVITGDIDDPQGVLIRACENAKGPGILTKKLGIDMSFNRRDIITDDLIRIEDDGSAFNIKTAPRIGIGYASKEDQEKPWRFILDR